MPNPFSFNLPMPTASTGTATFTPAGGNTGYEWAMSPADYLGYRSLDEAARQFDAQLAADQEHWEQQYNQAVEVAQIYAQEGTRQAQIAAGATTESARIQAEASMAHAQAQVEAAQIAAAAARYNADMDYRISQLDNQTKLTIAREANKIEAMKWEATQFQHPSAWAEQERWLAAGGAPVIETERRSVVPGMPSGFDITAEMPQVPEFDEAAYVRGQQLTPAAIEKLRGAQQIKQSPMVSGRTAPLSIVGEQGPEIARATPQGTVISPVTAGTASRLASVGVPRMALGGMVAPGVRRPPAVAPNRGAVRTLGAGGSTTMIHPRPTSTTTGNGDTGGAEETATTTPTTSTTPVTPSVLAYLRGEEPYPAWGGQQLAEFNVPGGENYGVVPLPGMINMVDFNRLPYDLQQMYYSAAEATYGLTPTHAAQWMQHFAPMGIASPVAVWG